MHELLLFAQVPSSRHDQVLNILAGISAMQPVPTLEKHLLFRPNRRPDQTKPVQVGAAQDIQKQVQAQIHGDVFYLQVVGEFNKGDDWNETNSFDEQSRRAESQQDSGVARALKAEQGKQTDRTSNWTIQFRDLPEVIRQRPVTSRLMASIPVSSGDPVRFMHAMDYRYSFCELMSAHMLIPSSSHVSSYYLSGHRFAHLNSSLSLYRAHVPSPSDLESMDITNDISHARLLDPSGAYILQAEIKVHDGSKVELMNKGMNELMNLKETLKGVVELDVGDRLAMDTRVR